MRQIILVGLLISMGCTTPKSGDDRRITLRGSFVSSTLSVSGASGGISLSGQLLWHCNAEGTRDGIVLQGVLREQP